ncbi:unnamed protein product [Symbiodinium natans]|uniref:Uncharacterized protein n=1 Tax=Symbiodinium natans TaxID=878477 RepID=A0A812PTP3_9DINO|nr:unnamed protein product [Symbiodinium natans]
MPGRTTRRPVAKSSLATRSPEEKQRLEELAAALPTLQATLADLREAKLPLQRKVAEVRQAGTRYDRAAALETRLALLENVQVREVEWTISDYSALLESCPKGQCVTSPTFAAGGVPNMQPAAKELKNKHRVLPCQLPSLPALPLEEASETLEAAGADALASTAGLEEAQLQEVRTLLADLQKAAVIERQHFRQRPPELGLGEDELLLFLGRERTKEARRPSDGWHGDSAAASAQRTEATATALLAVRHAAVQRRLALEQLRSEQLHSAEEFGLLREHLEALKNDPARAAQLAPHTATDLALSFAAALVRRKELLKNLGEATRARRELLRAAQRREQFLSCARAEPLRPELTESGTPATAAPAAVLAIAESLDAFGYSSSQSLAGRVRSLAERNVKLWKELSAAWSGKAGEAEAEAPPLVGPKEPEVEPKPVAGQLCFRKTPSIPAPAPPPIVPSRQRDGLILPSSLKGQALPGAADAASKMEETDIEPGQGYGLFDLDLEGPFQGWRKAARQSRLWKRRKREENARRYLGKWGRAQAVWALLGALHGLVSAYRPVADASSLSRGQRVRAHGQSGAFLSCTDKGVCKVLFDGTSDAQIVPTQDLDKIEPGHHPFMVAIVFTAWSVLSASSLQLATSRLRSDLAFHRAFGKLGRCLLSMAMLTDPRIAMKFVVSGWHALVAGKEAEKTRLRRLREVFKAWLEVLVMVKHNNVLDRLDETKLELEQARAKHLKAGQRCEWLKALGLGASLGWGNVGKRDSDPFPVVSGKSAALAFSVTMSVPTVPSWGPKARGEPHGQAQLDRACAMELDFWCCWVACTIC